MWWFVLVSLATVGVHAVLLLSSRRGIPGGAPAAGEPVLPAGGRDPGGEATAPLGAVDVADLLPVGVAVAGPDGRVEGINALGRGILGMDRSLTLVGAAARELVRTSGREGTEPVTHVDLFGPPERCFRVTVRKVVDRPQRLVIIEEVTEARRLEAVRRDFVANISHELRTPVGAVGLLAETLSEETDPDTIRRFAHRIGTETERLSRSIDDLLELSRIEHGSEMASTPTRVATVLTEAVERISAAAEQKGVGLTVTGSATSLEVLGDRRQLVSALYNLIENAVKYSPAGQAVDVGVAESDGQVEFTIRDRGPGIPRRDRERIFERFYRVDRARTRDTGGTGLGLSIVRHVAQNHGGAVRVHSVEGRGSTFVLSVPRGLGPGRTAGTRRPVVS